ncbi:uncharacterized protein LOC122246003 [Penaeus japonicus]|uniref:uncharacterized protein LOC122246003 n=1 Tax=Penaeus japonicus TaxID=27405 RepID=UPI001C716A44|nr:uncharacterized protein LOC122246003 [Penaeus japonicus]
MVLPLFLLIASFSSASLPDRYLPRPGAIVENVGSLYLVNNYAEVSVSLSTLSGVYNTASTHLSLISQYNRTIQGDTLLTAIQRMALTSFLNVARADLLPFKDRTPRPPARRVRRGWFDAVGDVTSYLFGVATHAELDARFDAYEKSMGSVVSRITGTFDTIHSITDTVNSLSRATRRLALGISSNANALTKEQHFSILLAQVSLYQSRVQIFIDHLNSLIHDLILAVHGTVTPTLLPPPALQSFLSNISSSTSFKPLFSISNSTLLYSQLTSFLTPQGLSIFVPLLPDVSYTGYNVHPFPVVIDQLAYKLATDVSFILMSNDHKSISPAPPSLRASCSDALPGVKVCSGAPIPERPYFHHTCSRALITNQFVHSSCMYDQISTDSDPFILTLPDANILYFFSSTQISLICNNTHRDMKVADAFFLPQFCQLNSERLTIRPSRRFLFDYLPQSPSLDPVSLSFPTVNVSIPDVNIRMLPNFTDQPDSFDFMSSHHVTFGFPVLTTLVGILLVFAAFCVYRKLVIRNLNRKVSKPVNDSHPID